MLSLIIIIMSKSYDIIKTSKIIPKYVADVKIVQMLDNGRKEISSNSQLKKYDKGSLISYLNKNNEFKLGGFLLEVTDDYFIYLATDFVTKFRARFKNIQKMWVGDVYSTYNDIVSLVKAKNKKTNFPVTVNNIVVYYAKNNFNVVRFKNTSKYKNMVKWVEYFCSE